MSRCRIVAYSVAVAVTISATRDARAQTVSASAVYDRADHALLGDLAGAAARLDLGLPNSALSVRLGVEYLSGRQQHTGTPCVGLVRPGTCGPEPVRDNARLAAAAGGIGVQVARWGALVLDAGADVRLARVHATTRGLTSGGAVSASKTLWGADLEVGALWSPWNQVPVGLELGLMVGTLGPVHHERLIDGYTPFNEGFATRRVRLGLAWQLSPR